MVDHFTRIRIVNVQIIILLITFTETSVNMKALTVLITTIQHNIRRRYHHFIAITAQQQQPNILLLHQLNAKMVERFHQILIAVVQASTMLHLISQAITIMDQAVKLKLLLS